MISVVILRNPRRCTMLKSLRNFVMTFLACASGCTREPPQSTSQPPNNVRGDSTINPLLLKLLRQHGLEATNGDGWVLVRDHPRICGAVVREMQPRPHVSSIQIDIYLEIESSQRILVESFDGVGTTKEEAISDAIQKFVANTFHVLLAAFYVDEGHHVETEQWMINGRPRHVTVGNIGICGKPPNPDRPPIGWFKRLEKEIKNSPLPIGTHWVRCYYAQMKNQATAVEVLLDNDEWEPIQSSMATLDWPSVEDFYSVRIFLVIQDEEG
jgi:Family of unknown function (DUF6348)